jgi:hypothetical protein
MKEYRDVNHPGNSPGFQTGKKCVEIGCNNPAGTAWSPYWCFECNVKRLDKISNQFENLVAKPDRAE